MRRGAPMLALIGFLCLMGCGQEDATTPPNSSSSEHENALNIGTPLYPVHPAAQDEIQKSGVAPIVLPDCRLTVIDRQDVPSQREGVILVIGAEIAADATVSADRLIEIEVNGVKKRYRRLKEGDRVKAGQALAQLDDRLACNDAKMKACKLAASRFDLEATEKTRDEAKTKLQRNLNAGRSVSAEELGAARLTFDRYKAEAGTKSENLKLASHEAEQANIIVEQHKIRAAISGKIKAIYKRRGEAVRQHEPIFQIHDLSRLRIEGVAAIEHLDRLRHADGLRVVVEPSHSSSPVRALVGHLQEVSAVAVSGDSKLIVSAGADGRACVWPREGRHEHRILRHDSAVRSVACTPAASSRNLCATGASDGTARIWDLDGDSPQPLVTLAEKHKGIVTGLAFSPGGNWLATAGEDRQILLFEMPAGNLKYRFPAGHRSAITSIQFTPRAQLVSAGRDHTLRVWELGGNAARLTATIQRRSGYVLHPGVSPDGSTVLLDQGNVLRLLTLEGQRTMGILTNPAEGAHFTTFATYSPDGVFILAAGAAEGRLQLWRAPWTTSRPHIVRQLVAGDDAPATCAAFAPDGSFIVTGTKGRQVLVWSLPPAEEQPLTARVSLIEESVESSARQVRFWAEVDNADGKLVPGTNVTLAVYPR